MLYEINFSKYISEKYPDCWCWKKVNADSKEEAINLLYDLMGEDVEPRRNFIMENVDFSEIKE